MVNYGLTFTYVDTSVAENVAAAITPATKLVHIETPTNPMMSITDIRAVAEICHARGVELSVDNTFLSPYFQQPIALGADIVMHSTTSLEWALGWAGWSVGLYEAGAGGTVSVCAEVTGGILSPFDSYLLLRGVKTLAVRMKQHDENGRVVADFLKEHPAGSGCFIRGSRIIRSMSWRRGSRAGSGR